MDREKVVIFKNRSSINSTLEAKYNYMRYGEVLSNHI